MLGKLKIGTRLGIAFSVVVAFIVVLAAIGYGTLNNFAKELDILVNQNDKKVTIANDLREDLNTIMRSLRNVLLYQGNDAAVAAQKKRIETARSDYEESYQQLSKLLVTDEERKILSDIDTYKEPSKKATDDVIAAAANLEEAVSLMKGSAQSAQNEWYDSIQGMIDFQHKQSEAAAAAAQTTFKRTLAIFMIFTLLAVVLATVLAFWITRSITKPIDYAVKVANAVATGDLSSHVVVTSGDETARLMLSLQRMKESLINTVASVRSVADSLEHSSADLVHDARQVTDSSSLQSAAAASTASSVQEITVSIDSVARGAEEIRVLAKSSQSLTRESSDNLNKLSREIDLLGSTVEAISSTFREFVSSSQAITGMTRQVREIAEQTNLLALNAAIEAARAGEQGRGFAVVADEVRKLAEKSSQSVNEIDAVTRVLNERSSVVAGAISEGMDALASSKRHVHTVITSLSEADKAARGTAEGIDNIANSANEQSAASTEISRNVERMAEMAEKNHSAVQRTNEAADNLRQLSGELSSSVSRFKLN
jgi:methyl-accepting chemotaxis protein